MMSEVAWLDIFGDNLVSAMLDANLTQRDLADMSGLSEATISYYIRKQKIPTLRSILRLSYALDISTDDLIDFGDIIE